jgi:murein DD-endopeptidase MepM/ murein hydrolase activator NlpD
MFIKTVLIFITLLGGYSFVFASDSCEGYIRPVKLGWLSSAFGYRTDPFTGGRDFHEGVDFATKASEKAYASNKGVVTFSGELGSHGNRIEITHENGDISTYSHLGSIVVKIDEQVERGQVIGVVGPTTGLSTGPHVGFELIIDGEKVNPLPYVYGDKINICSSSYSVK